jgi:hypothetical protein
MTRRAIVVVGLLAAACGGQTPTAAIRNGAVVYRDALADNRGGWLEHGRDVGFAGGRYVWRGFPPGIDSSPDALATRRIPAGVVISVGVVERRGASLRAIACRELGPAEKPVQEWYELGVDGRQALIRRMSVHAAPRVLAREKLRVPDGKRVALSGACVPDAKGGLVLALRVDGREVARARDGKPLSAGVPGVDGLPSLRAYPRPDSHVDPAIAWDSFEVRRALLS